MGGQTIGGISRRPSANCYIVIRVAYGCLSEIRLAGCCRSPVGRLPLKRGLTSLGGTHEDVVEARSS